MWRHLSQWQTDSEAVMAFRNKFLIRFSNVINQRKWYFTFLPPVFLYNLSVKLVERDGGDNKKKQEGIGIHYL
jgi:hypothetical protein